MQVSLAEMKDILERYKVNTPKMQRAIAKRGCALIAREAVSNVNNDLVMKRTGGLMQYIGAMLATQRETDNSVSIGLPRGERQAIIGRVQEEGATIHAKNWFTKPSKAHPEGTGPWLIFPRAGGDWWTQAGVVSQASGVKPGFAMVKQVTLRARHWFSSAVEFYKLNMVREAGVVLKQFLQSGGTDGLS